MVNAGKTEIIHFNSEASDMKIPRLMSDPCQIKCQTKSLRMKIDNQLANRHHPEATAENAKRKSNTTSCLCDNKWILTIPTLILLYQTTNLPLFLFDSPIWFERDCCSMQSVRKNFIRMVFKNSYSSNITGRVSTSSSS